MLCTRGCTGVRLGADRGAHSALARLGILANRIETAKTRAVAGYLAAVAEGAAEPVLAVIALAVTCLVTCNTGLIVGFAQRCVAVGIIRTLRIVLGVAARCALVPSLTAVGAGVETTSNAILFDAGTVYATLACAHNVARRAQSAIGNVAVGNVGICRAIAIVIEGVAKFGCVIVDGRVCLIAVRTTTVVALAAKVTVGINAANVALTHAHNALR